MVIWVDVMANVAGGRRACCGAPDPGGMDSGVGCVGGDYSHWMMMVEIVLVIEFLLF